MIIISFNSGEWKCCWLVKNGQIYHKRLWEDKDFVAPTNSSSLNQFINHWETSFASQACWEIEKWIRTPV